LQLRNIHGFQVVKLKAAAFLSVWQAAAAKSGQLHTSADFEGLMWKKNVALHARIALFCRPSASSGDRPH
jgi:hypothetical protein